jgi:hypothetical protein
VKAKSDIMGSASFLGIVEDFLDALFCAVAYASFDVSGVSNA